MPGVILLMEGSEMNENMLIEDFNWFKENYESFYKKYGHCFVAVKNKQVLGDLFEIYFIKNGDFRLKDS